MLQHEAKTALGGNSRRKDQNGSSFLLDKERSREAEMSPGCGRGGAAAREYGAVASSREHRPVPFVPEGHDDVRKH